MCTSSWVTVRSYSTNFGEVETCTLALADLKGCRGRLIVIFMQFSVVVPLLCEIKKLLMPDELIYYEWYFYFEINNAHFSTYHLVSVESGKNKATVRPPSERPGVKRTAEMKLLYGKGAAMIHGMETAMQLTFDRNCDMKQPKLWPHLPLNIKFDWVRWIWTYHF